MSRLGEGDLQLSHYVVGSIWVSHISAEPAFHPRLLIAAGCQLKELTAESLQGSKGISDYKIATLGGQLRWQSASGPIVGDLSTPRGIEHIRSAQYAPEHQFTMCCDLYPHTLEHLEAARGGGPVVFWMDLVGSWAIAGDIEPIYQSAWQFSVPNDMWLAFLERSGFLDYDVVEFRKRLSTGESLKETNEYLRAARRLAVEGEPGKAVGLCRLVFEAATAAVATANEGSELGDYLRAHSDEKRGEQYSRLVSAVKQLSSLDHHHFGRGVTYSRPEALAIIRITEALLLLFEEIPSRASA